MEVWIDIEVQRMGARETEKYIDWEIERQRSTKYGDTKTNQWIERDYGLIRDRNGEIERLRERYTDSHTHIYREEETERERYTDSHTHIYTEKKKQKEKDTQIHTHIHTGKKKQKEKEI
jgi:hypothetical protein